MIEQLFVILIGSALVDRESLNAFMDFFVPIYCIISTVAIVSFFKYKQSYKPHDRVYVYTAEVDESSLSWKQRMAGTWNSHERENFKEFLIFNGAPSFLAGSVASKPSSLELEISADEKQLKYEAKGVPPSKLDWTSIGTSLEDAPEVSQMEKEETSYQFWADEEQQIIHCRTVKKKSGTVIFVDRKITEDGLLETIIEATKPSGESCRTVTRFKKVKR